MLLTYGSTVQFSYALWDSLLRQHYRAIRAAVRDIRRTIPHPVLDIISKRATPKEWTNCASISTAIKLYNQNNTRLSEVLRNHEYNNDRKPRRATSPDLSKRLNCPLQYQKQAAGHERPSAI